MAKRHSRLGAAIGWLIVIILILIPILVFLYTDWLWFLAIDYGSVFLTVLSTEIYLGLGLGLLAIVLLYINFRIINKAYKKPMISRKHSFYISAFFGFIIGVASSSAWQIVLNYIHQVPFGIADPVFSLDIGFYVFSLPFYTFLVAYFFGIFLLALIISSITYFVHGSGVKSRKVVVTADDIEFEKISEFKFKMPDIGKFAKKHLSALFGIILLMLSALFWIGQYGLLFSTRGVVFGASYTDLVIFLPLIVLLSVISLVFGLALIANAKIGSKKIVKYGSMAFVGIIILGLIAGGVVQYLVVAPDELTFETPYIERNIQFTLQGYGLDKINEVEFPVIYNLTTEDITNNNATIDNIRLWDWRPLRDTYSQLQLFRTYYRFSDVDIDRYNINGNYKQVMLSPREMDIDSLTDNAQTWVNRHLVYTHGHGLVMSPVNDVSSEGLPNLYIKDIPPKSSFDLEVDRPEIYYGELTHDYAITDTTTEELDYPMGEENVYTIYQGSGGVGLSSILDRLLFAIRFGSIEILTSNSLTSQSRILFNRDIQTRTSTIAPFLKYDHDPYMVVSDGNLYWIYDAYTITDMYPYSETIFEMDGYAFNYIRNSVKMVVDAYNGDATFYVIDKNDPLIRTYMNIFPDLFKDFDLMSADLKQHIRYPEDLFFVQSELYTTYHMNNPRVFYNKEDAWKIPNEVYSGSKVKLEPYYIIMQLPNAPEEEFVLILPFTPKAKDNMIGWMVAKSDINSYGDIDIYKFSKQELIYGPMQIEARIDQDTEISQKITLWSQIGSQVIRGNLVVIPVENSILYIEPLYLQANENSIPELKRVIVAYGNKLTMQETLEDALSIVFSGTVPTETDTVLSQEELISKANEYYEKALEAQQNGDWSAYGEWISKLGEILEQLE